MLLFVLSDGPAAGQAIVCSRFPFTIGRQPGCDLQLAEPGVWDVHAEVLHEPSGRYVVRSLGDALLLINNERCGSRALVPGDELLIGSARLTVSLAPVFQKSLRIAEAGVVTVILFVALAEAALLAVLR